MDNPLRFGVFTPQADVLCWKCHGRKMPHGYRPIEDDCWAWMSKDYKDGEDLLQTMQGHEYDDIANITTKCSRCGCDTIVDRTDVVVCDVVVQTLRGLGIDAHLDQTGGMCVAGGLRTKQGHYIMWTEDEESEDHLYIGAYRDEDDWSNGIASDSDHFPVEDAASEVVRMANEGTDSPEHI